ncbi:hypothetical protein BMR06_17545, partial [Methylococcaceae bacterium HT5]
ALKIDNTVECWGKSGAGETTVSEGLIAKQITSGYSHTCALKIDNTVECWGRPGVGETIVPESLIAKQITSGHSHACALKIDNTVECWGNNEIVNKKPTNLVAKQL